MFRRPKGPLEYAAIKVHQNYNMPCMGNEMRGESGKIYTITTEDGRTGKARFVNDAPISHWLWTEGHPLSNAFVSTSEVVKRESWESGPLPPIR